ncbi:DUF6119 family protein [Streptomyces sp. CoT10]|uniref:DUF6119 family protein n=1 Tax=Streptomyces sp. CoT10 TaxID=2875762 RepID=UPI001CD6835A|nr:DUF6119 family protein [Streptomyces sp. CoT10]
MPESQSTDTTKPPATRPTTLYLLQNMGTEPEELRAALRPRYAEYEGFATRDITVDGIRAVASYGRIGAQKRPGWMGVAGKLIGETLDLTNHTAAAVILLPVDKRVFAICFGSGHLLLESACVTPSFGLDFALRTVDPNEVSQLTHTVMDARAHTDRSSTARGQHVRSFDLDEYGEICTRIVGSALETGLSAEQNPRIKKVRPRITGSDSLKVHLASDPELLVKDLRTIGERLESKPADGFEVISYVRRLAPADPIVARLDEKLAEYLDGASAYRRIALTAPSELLDKMPEAESLRIRLGGRTELVPLDEVSLEGFRPLLEGLTADKRLSALKGVKMQMMSDVESGTPVGRGTDALKWIAAEIPLDNNHFFFHEHKWYQIGADHLTHVRAEVKRLFDESTDFGLPAWPTQAEMIAQKLKDPHEQGYNQMAAKKLGGAFLDRKLIKCELHPRGFEAADVATTKGALIHVKRADGSGELSHLFVQGRVSADALYTEADANRKFVDAVREQYEDFPEETFKPRDVVFAIALKTGADLTPDSLFTVSQVSLLHAARGLQNLGINVHIQGINYGRRAVADRAEAEAKKREGSS